MLEKHEGKGRKGETEGKERDREGNQGRSRILGPREQNTGT